MSDPDLSRYRVTYTKKGRLAMLSHLEVTHALEHMIRRAQLPFAVTQGFSPHMKLGFGTALPVGVASVCEVLDVFLTEPLPAALVLKRLQDMSPEDLYPLTCKVVRPSEPAATMAYPYTVYEAIVSPAEAFSLPPALKVPEVITVAKETKSKDYTVAEFVETPPICALDGDGLLHIGYTLHVRQEGSLRPDVFLKELLAESGIEGHVDSIVRTAQKRMLMC